MGTVARRTGRRARRRPGGFQGDGATASGPASSCDSSAWGCAPPRRSRRSPEHDGTKPTSRRRSTLVPNSGSRFSPSSPRRGLARHGLDADETAAEVATIDRGAWAAVARAFGPRLAGRRRPVASAREPIPCGLLPVARGRSAAWRRRSQPRRPPPSARRTGSRPASGRGRSGTRSRPSPPGPAWTWPSTTRRPLPCLPRGADPFGLTRRERDVLPLLVEGPNEPTDRRGAVHQREHRRRPRVEHPRQARRVDAHGSGGDRRQARTRRRLAGRP